MHTPAHTHVHSCAAAAGSPPAKLAKPSAADIKEAIQLLAKQKHKNAKRKSKHKAKARHGKKHQKRHKQR
jgi:hypothetical protein